MDIRRKNILLAASIAVFAVLLYAYSIYQVVTSHSGS